MLPVPRTEWNITSPSRSNRNRPCLHSCSIARSLLHLLVDKNADVVNSVPALRCGKWCVLREAVHALNAYREIRQHISPSLTLCTLSADRLPGGFVRVVGMEPSLSV